MCGLLIGLACTSLQCAPVEEEPARPVLDQPPVAVLDAPRVVAVDEELFLDGSASVDLDGEVVDAVLLFGDGSEPELRLSARHRYARAGRFVAELLIEDDAGLRARARLPIEVVAP